MKNKIIFLILWMLPAVGWAQGPVTIRQVMDEMHRTRGVNFVYDSSLNVGQAYKGPDVKALPLKEALQRLFRGSGIDYTVKGKYVMLKATALPLPKRKGEAKRWTVSGYVRDEQGETLLNATVYDLTTGQGTMTNEHGFFSLTLPEGEHRLRVSYIGFEDHVEALRLHGNREQQFVLKENAHVGEVVVTADLNSPVTGTQMGKRSLSQQDIKTEFSLLSSPDVVKALQRLSGVQEGIEVASGLYVHGGNNDENLFLIDGTPLYQINHSMGLFSSFNADVVKNVDFYKSGFPARYGGRLSSVVDVRTNDGNWERLHGSYRIGLLDGGFQLDGPIKLKSEKLREQKGEKRGVDFGTSFNIGLRRSWLDLLSRPAFAIANHFNDEENITLAYDFYDLNAKLTHIFNRRSQMNLSIYNGQDALTTKDDWREAWQGDDYSKLSYHDVYKNRFRWGNLNAALNWRYQFSPKLLANFTAVYTHNRASLLTTDNEQSFDKQGDVIDRIYLEHRYRSTISDLGYRSEFDFRPSPRHHIRFGHDYTYHQFRPQTRSQVHLWGVQEEADSLTRSSRNHHAAHELTLYGEDQLTLSDRWSLNAGLNLSLFGISSKAFVGIDPRLAVKYQLRENLAAKASYTMMTQYVHKISNSVLELPTDYWVPTTERLRPMHSQQWAAGIYWSPHLRNHASLTLSLEGYYKLTRNLLQYNSWGGLVPPAQSWDQLVSVGRGRFYGLELDAQYRTKRLQADLAYTLSWNERRFDDFYHDWYYDKFDNRHKLNLSLRYSFSKKTQMYAAWTYHTGNHMTLPTQYVQMPALPGEAYTQPLLEGKGAFTSFSTHGEFIYERPNNITLPAYHRLDVGFNFRHATKHGHERIWNLSVYNAYCHLNPLWVELEYKELSSNKVDLSGHQNFSVKTRGYIPVIPSVSYTIKF